MAGRGEDDGSAPLFFLLAMLMVIVGPWALSLLWWLLFPGSKQVQQTFPTQTERGETVRHCRTQGMNDKREAHIAKLRSRTEGCTRGFALRTCILAVLMCWLMYIVVQLRAVTANSSLYADFDPFALLGVSSSASRSDIKKSYHRMSLKYHPDKNPDPAAAEKFILIKKAFDALTDPTAKRNFALYGNPDGPTRVELSVALPKFSKEQQGPVLILFLVVFILGLPLSVLFCCMGTSAVGSNGILIETAEAVKDALSSTTTVREAQALLLACGESRRLPIREGEEELLSKLAEELRDKAPKGKGEAQLSKAEILFLAHTKRRHAALSGHMLKDLEEILPKWRALSLLMADQATKQGDPGAVPPALQLCRCLVQALETNATESGSATLLQVPHVDAETLKLAWKKGKVKCSDVMGYAEMREEERRTALEAAGLSAEAVLDAEEFARCLPRVRVSDAIVEVDGEDEICKGDIATLRVKFLRENLLPGEAAGAAHTPHFPSAAVPEAWWLSFAVAGGRGGPRWARVVSTGRESVATVRFQVPAEGKTRGQVTLCCEAYAGLEVQHEVWFKAQKADSHVSKGDAKEALEAEGEDSESCGSGAEEWRGDAQGRARASLKRASKRSR